MRKQLLDFLTDDATFRCRRCACEGN